MCTYIPCIHTYYGFRLLNTELLIGILRINSRVWVLSVVLNVILWVVQGSEDSVYLSVCWRSLWGFSMVQFWGLLQALYDELLSKTYTLRLYACVSFICLMFLFCRIFGQYLWLFLASSAPAGAINRAVEYVQCKRVEHGERGKVPVSWH